jgi:DNA-binding FadR family transcriptional regulator
LIGGPYGPEPPLSAVHDSVVETIADWIVASRFPAGTTLPVEQAICHELSASRTTVREALKTLAAKGLVRVGPRVGTRVLPVESWNLLDPHVVAWRLRAPLSPDLVEDLVELRLLIEPGAAEVAARKAQPADLARLRDAFDRMTCAVDGHGSYIEADLAFHQIILDAACNQFLSKLAPVIGAVLRLSFALSVRSLDRARASLPNHKALLEAIAAGKPAEAHDCLVAIIVASRADMECALSQSSTETNFIRLRERG